MNDLIVLVLLPIFTEFILISFFKIVKTGSNLCNYIKTLPICFFYMISTE